LQTLDDKPAFWKIIARNENTANSTRRHFDGIMAPRNKMPSDPANLTEFQVEGMTCNNCVRHVTAAIQGVAGVRAVTVKLSAARASVSWNAAATHNTSAIVAAVTRAGFSAREISATTPKTTVQTWHLNLWLGLSVVVLLMLGEWAFGLGDVAWFRWTSFVLATVVQIICGASFYQGAWRQIKVGQSNMDTLVALGSTTAYLFSTWVMLSGASGHVYFMEAAAIIAIVSLGHWIEGRISERSSGALKSLLELAPAVARKLSAPPTPEKTPISPLNLRQFQPAVAAAPPTEIEVPVATLKIGDVLVLLAGDRVPVDGVVTAGASAVDESMLTGEAMPVEKKPGEELFAGTVNLNGRLLFRVTATGDTTALAHVIAAVARAQNSRADIQRLGDRISSVFVPVIVTIALAAGIGWGFAPQAAQSLHTWLAHFLWHSHVPAGLAAGFIIASAVLIIACPCAMGLATPAAIMAAANAAARRGFLIRDGVALEKAGRITAIIFDKTGTLTAGKPRVVASQNLPAPPPADLTTFTADQLAASLAALSNHPLSRAIAAANPARATLRDFQELAGRGIMATIGNNHQIRLGSLAWLAEEHIPTESAQTFADEWMNRGATVLGLTVNHQLGALFALQDTLKPAAARTLNRLRQEFLPPGQHLYLLSGDSQRTAQTIGQQLDLPPANVIGEIRPEQKAEFVKKLQAQGQRVAFVGDGINDAPALVQADLGIAVGRASDIAREAADIILLKSDIEIVPEALDLARATLRIIKQNLFWAFFYNALGVPLAALGFVSPVFCAAAMGFSDIIVIGNALRLLRR
jgi:Cu+-exporting ATPase